jgi:pimeloyl-ACP methyl ester carboxylesterase
MERRYLYTGSRRVHYRAYGAGPPLVLLHDCMETSFALEMLALRYADKYRVVALDLPGYGESQALDIRPSAIADYVRALLDTLNALGLQRIRLYGHGAGAALAIAFALAHPQHICELLFCDLVDSSNPERDELLRSAVPSLEPELDGTHVLRAWSMQRNRFMFSPWCRQDALHRLHIPMASADVLHDRTVELLRSWPAYGDLLRAALDYPAHMAISRLTCIVEDFSAAGLREEERALPSAFAFLGHGSGEIRRTYVQTSIGPLLLRFAGGGATKPLVLMHASPQSAATLEPLMLALSKERPVLAFDTPGNGDSAACEGKPSIADLAAVLGEALDCLSVVEFDLYGTHTGATIAIELALLRPEQVGRIILDGLSIFSAEEVAEYTLRYALPMEVRGDGSHLIWAWNLMHDMTYWFPWFKQTPNFALQSPRFNPARFHAAFLEFLKGARTYHLSYKASFAHPTSARLTLLRQPVLLCAGPRDVLLSHLPAASAALPTALARTTAGGSKEETVGVYRAFLSSRIPA